MVRWFTGGMIVIATLFAGACDDGDASEPTPEWRQKQDGDWGWGWGWGWGKHKDKECDDDDGDGSHDWNLVCRTSKDCDEDEFCMLLDGQCGGLGMCAPKPADCPDLDMPVCACDGAEYKNGCEAAMYGESVDYKGECAPATCLTDLQCGAGEYCAKATGDCLGAGVCTPTPPSCGAVYNPVCGCDLQTYDNACNAAKAGESVASLGTCP